MRKIDLTEYDVEVDTPDGIKTLPYDMKRSTVGILYHPDNKLNARDLLENDRVAQKIAASNGSVLLEEHEYNRLKMAVECGKGYTKQDVKLVTRILDAPFLDPNEVVKAG